MYQATQAFINRYRNKPIQAMARIDVYAMHYQLFDSQYAARMCGLVWREGSYRLRCYV